MNEAEIVAQLAKKLPQTPYQDPTKSQADFDVAPVIKDATTVALKEINTGPNTIGAMRLMDHFAVPGELQRDQTTLEKLGYIFDTLATQNGSSEPTDVMLELRQLEQMLGLTFREDKLEAIWRWLKLDAERRRIDKEQSII